jgi:hypothetical protein
LTARRAFKSFAAEGSPQGFEVRREAPLLTRLCQLGRLRGVPVSQEWKAELRSALQSASRGPNVFRIALASKHKSHSRTSNKRSSMKRIILYLAIAALLLPNAFADLSRVTVKSNRFVTADGKTIVFRGLDASDPDKLERNGRWNRDYFKTAKSWGANLVRLPVHPAAWRIRGKKDYIKLLDEGVDWAEAEGMYVIIDWHSIGNLPSEKFFPVSSELYPTTAYTTTREETFDFWRAMAKRYRTNTTVAFFELFNEPALGGEMGSCTWTEWKTMVEELIATIRESKGTAIPLVAGFDFGYDLKPVATNPINAEGIGYVSHPYPMKAKQPWDENWMKDWGFVAEKYPLFLTEFGFVGPDDKSGYNPIIGDESYGDALVSFCNKRGISWSVWCFDPHWGPTLIKDWNFTPTRQGLYFKKVMQTKLPE